MEGKKTIQVRNKDAWHSSWICPYCGSRDLICTERPSEKKVTRNEDNYYPGDKEIYHDASDFKCKSCLKEFTLDYGESTYLIYDDPTPMDNMREILCHSVYESEMHQNFRVCSTLNPENESERVFFIEYERDRSPIFITRKLMEEMLHDCKEIAHYLYCCWMTRYR